MEELILFEYDEQWEKYLKEMDSLKEEYKLIISEDIDSGLSGSDYAFAMLVGIIGALITSSEEVQKLLNGIHEIASAPIKENDSKFDRLVKYLLGHYNSNIDTLPNGPNGRRTFPTRVPDAKRSGPHRIFYGHDILSIGKDNPFLLSIEQEGSVMKGILAAIKHLTADTFSKQGLPIPTSSWYDYTFDDGKRVGNRLLDFCNKLYKESGKTTGSSGSNNEFFNHMFSIHIQDIAVQQVAGLLCKKYIKIKKINDKIVQHQFKLITYSVMFYLNCMIGYVRYKIPYINWNAGVCITKEYFQMYSLSWWELRKFEKKTNEMVKETEELIRKIQEKNYSSSAETLENKLKSYIE